MVSKLLDFDDLEAINLALARADELEPELARAASAGFDVTEKQAELQERRARLRAIKSSFFPEAE